MDDLVPEETTTPEAKRLADIPAPHVDGAEGLPDDVEDGMIDDRLLRGL